MSDISVNQVTFRPKARLLYIVGGDLIKDEMAGIIELVKNAYDADAKQVTISLRYLNSKNRSTIVVDDNGHGMSLSSIENGWLSPATNNKEQHQFSPGGRPMQGRKGVGRFAAMRLGNTLRLETTPGVGASEQSANEQGNSYRIDIKWGDFINSDQYLDQIAINLTTYRSTKGVRSPQGTRLEIAQLQDEWNLNRIERLYRELRLLLSPLNATPTQQDFKIAFDLKSSGLSVEVIKRFDPEIIPVPLPEITDYHVFAHINPDGNFRVVYNRLLWAKQDQLDARVEKSGEDIRRYFLEEFQTRFGVKTIDQIPQELPCGPLEIRFHIWDRDTEILEAKVSNSSSTLSHMGMRRARQFLNEISGVALYRDQFRVRPYGDEDKDWMGLGQRRVQRPVGKIGPNQLFGLVEISNISNPGLDDQASREGLKENDAYWALKACVLAVLDLIEPYRYQFRDRNRLGRPTPGSSRALIEEREKAFTALRDHVIGLVIDEKGQNHLTRLIENAEKTSLKEQTRFVEQTRLLHDTHALGLLARFVLHEGGNLSGALDSGISNLEYISRHNRSKDPEQLVIANESLKTFDTSLSAMSDAMKRLDGMLDQLDPVTRPRSTRRSNVTVEEVLRNVCQILDNDIQNASITISLPRHGSHKVYLWEADLFHAIYNLLHNSIYWVQFSTADSKREIVVNIESTGASDPPQLQITISDSGPGIRAQSAPAVFDLGYTEKSGGYGVGLFIAREAIERSGGAIELLNPGERGAQFQIILDEVKA